MLKTFFVVSLFFNLILGILFFNQVAHSNTRDTISSKDGSHDYKLLAKRLFVEEPNDSVINFKKLRGLLDDYATLSKDSVSIYFEYLPTGASVGINDNNEIKIASLAKVPVVIAAYKLIDEGKLTEQTPMVLTESQKDSKSGDLWKIKTGTTLTVAEVAKITLQKSDNTAVHMLVDLVGQDAIDDVYDSFDVPHDLVDSIQTVSVRDYSSLLKSLYYASYVSPESSEKILDLLSNTEYRDKIPAGVPSDIVVSHKVGIFTQPNMNQSVYSDCGIVYVPSRPYLLCLMTTSSEQQATLNFKNISNIVYSYVANLGDITVKMNSVKKK